MSSKDNCRDAPSRSEPPWRIDAATAADVAALAVIWHDGWRDGHLGYVPDELLPERRLPDFERRLPERLPTTSVARRGGDALGFVTVVDDEIEQIYVARAARATGVATDLLRHGEAVIAGAGRRLAWLAVVEGNQRARAFYAREGWHDAGPLDYWAQGRDGQLLVPSRRYEKVVTAGER